MMILGFILLLILNYVHICRVYADAWGSQKTAWEPWRWISKQLFAAQYGHWEPNICPMEEQQVLLTTEAVLFRSRLYNRDIKVELDRG